jgi:superfamily I DNA/RNA helicase
MSEEQLAAIMHDLGPCRVLSPAGSGKTRVVVHRIARMVAEGTDPARILALTFSKKAAGEMSTRAARLGNDGVRVGTWHSVALEILRKDRQACAAWSISDTSRSVLKKVLGFKGMDWKGADTNLVAGFISKCKAHLHEPDSAEAAARAAAMFSGQASRALEAFHHYNQECEIAEILTYDDFLVKAARHLEVEENRTRWAARWEYLIQDEMQDENPAQKRIVRLLAGDHQNYMAVGDVMQAIYGFRESTPDSLVAFEEEWPGAKTYWLTGNYRSGTSIVDAANGIISSAVVRGYEPRPLVARRSVAGTVRVQAAEDLDDEADSFAQHVQNTVKNGDAKYSDHCACGWTMRTNALSSAHAKDRAEPTRGSGALSDGYDDGRRGQGAGVQPNNCRSVSRGTGSASQEEANGGSERKVEGRSVHAEQRLHHGAGKSSEVSDGASRRDGANPRSLVAERGDRSSPRRGQGEQRGGESEAVFEQRGTHARGTSQAGGQDASRCPSCSEALALVTVDACKYQDWCCLFRTNAQSRALEEALIGERIPYVVVGGVSFYERKEIKQVLAYLRLAEGRGEMEDVEKCINAPFRFLGKAFVERVADVADDVIGYNQFARDVGSDSVDWGALVREVSEQGGVQFRQRESAEGWASILDRMRARISGEDAAEARPSTILDDLVRETRFIEWMTKDEGADTLEVSQGANVRELIRVAERFATARELLDYIDTTLREARAQREDRQAGGNRVLLMNVHRSKGLEWPRVWVAGFNEKIFPHPMGDEQEERRLAYVAVTRARDELVVSHVRTLAMRAGIMDAVPSRFIGEIAQGMKKKLVFHGGAAKGPLADMIRSELENMGAGAPPDGSA